MHILFGPSHKRQHSIAIGSVKASTKLDLTLSVSSKRYICVCKYVREVIGVSKPVISNAGHAK